MTKQEATAKAIDRIKGQEIELGRIIGSRLDPLTYKLIRYDGEDAICDKGDGVEHRFPRSEIFDVKKAINVANHYLNMGLWEEGMESTIITLS